MNDKHKIIVVIALLVSFFCIGFLCARKLYNDKYTAITNEQRDDFQSTINRLYDDVGRVQQEVGLSLQYTGQLREQLIELRRISEYTYIELELIRKSMATTE